MDNTTTKEAPLLDLSSPLSPPAYSQTPSHDGSALNVIPSSTPNTFPAHLIQDETPTQPPPVAQAPLKPQPIQTLAAPPQVRPLEQLRETPEYIDCPFCKKMALTRVAQEPSAMTNIAGFLCCLVCICAACVPCICGWCHDTDHYCTACRAKVAHLPHEGQIQVFRPGTTGTVPSQYAQVQPMQYPQPVAQEMGKAPL